MVASKIHLNQTVTAAPVAAQTPDVATKTKGAKRKATAMKEQPKPAVNAKAARGQQDRHRAWTLEADGRCHIGRVDGGNRLAGALGVWLPLGHS